MIASNTAYRIIIYRITKTSLQQLSAHLNYIKTSLSNQ
jgi:hypothetical protein